MLRFGEAPFLECSSKGDKRLSAFYARIKSRGGKSIEELYQAAKVFEDGSSGLTPKEAKGKKAVNQEEMRVFYSRLWREYFIENPELFLHVCTYTGFSDVFGQANHACQAEEIYRLVETFR